jgi:hypothetical protein
VLVPLRYVIGRIERLQHRFTKMVDGCGILELFQDKINAFLHKSFFVALKWYQILEANQLIINKGSGTKQSRTHTTSQYTQGTRYIRYI